jgi:hypothetical protein
MRAPESLSNNFSAIKNKMDMDYTNNLSLWSIAWTQGNIDVRLEAGDPSLMAQLNSTILANGSNSYYFNRVRPICNAISGYQRRNRKSTVVIPLENGDQKTADQFSKILLHIYKKELVNETISEAFHQGACITGMNLLQVYLDFTTDPINGDIKVDNLAYNEFMIDPYFRQWDLSDASFVWRRSFMTHSAAAAIMPEEYYDSIMSLAGNPTGMARDGRFQYMAESYGYAQGNRISYDEYWYRDYRQAKILYDKVTGEVLDVSREEEEHIKTFLQQNENIELVNKKIPTVRLCIRLQDEVYYDGENPLGVDGYPFIPVIGYYQKSMPYMYQRIQGVCRQLRDPQYLFNRRVILSADLLESTANSGWIFKENSVLDVKHLFQTGQGRIIPLKEEAQMTDIQQIVPPQIPNSFFQLQEVFDKELYNCAGLSEENLGKIVGDDASGYLSALRQGAGLTAQQPIFDRLDLSQKMLGERIMQVIQCNYTPGKIRRILEGEEPADLFYNKAFGKYHCMVEEGFDTESQRQMEFAQLLKLREVGIQIPDTAMIEKATIQGKEDLMKDMQQKAELQYKMQQQQMQLQMQELQARAELSHARSEADRGLAYERIARVEENHALAQKQLAEANKEDELALLNKVKILKELETIDLSHLQTLINLSNSMKHAEQQTVKPIEPLKKSEAAIAEGSAAQPQVENNPLS